MYSVQVDGDIKVGDLVGKVGATVNVAFTCVGAMVVGELVALAASRKAFITLLKWLVL